MGWRVAGMAAIVLVLASGAALAAGDAGKGQAAFQKCVVCHSAKPGENKVGPSLAGIVGRKPGSQPGFSYSPAMTKQDRPWDEAGLDAYLADPRGAIPGNKMIYPGAKNPEERADLIAYLATLK